MELYVTEIFYSDYSIKPAKGEIFLYQPELGLIYVFDITIFNTNPRKSPTMWDGLDENGHICPTGAKDDNPYPFEHPLIEVINVKQTKSFTLNPFFTSPRESLLETPSSAKAEEVVKGVSEEPPVSESSVQPSVSGSGSTNQPNPNTPDSQILHPSTPEVSPEQICTCEDIPNPTCPFHGSTEFR